MVWIIGGGGGASMCKACSKQGGLGACSPPENFNFQTFIRYNLRLFSLKTMFPYLNTLANICMTIPVGTASSKKDLFDPINFSNGF